MAFVELKLTEQDRLENDNLILRHIVDIIFPQIHVYNYGQTVMLDCSNIISKETMEMWWSAPDQEQLHNQPDLRDLYAAIEELDTDNEIKVHDLQITDTAKYYFPSGSKIAQKILAFAQENGTVVSTL